MSAPNLQKAARAPFWNQFEGQGALSQHPVDNLFQETGLDQNGKTVNTRQPSDSLSRTRMNNPGGTIVAGALATSPTPTITPAAAAAATWTYAVVAKMANGTTSSGSSTGSTTTGAETLDSTHYNTISFTSIAGATSYDIYRTVAATSPSTTGIIGTVSAAAQPTTNNAIASGSALSFVDDGSVAGGSETAPTVNTTGGLQAAKVFDFAVAGLAAPQNVTATPFGTTGATTVTYKVTALTATGNQTTAGTGTTTTANATQTTAHGNTVAWNAVPGAITYNVFRSVGGASQGLIGTATGTGAATYSLSDTGLAGDSTTAPTVNQTGSITAASPKFTNGLFDVNGNEIVGFSATASAVNYFNVTNAATGNPAIVASAGSDTNIGLTANSKGTGAVTVAPGAAGGTIVIGKADQTGAITVGSSSGTESVLVADGAGIATVNVANSTTAGATVSVAGAATATGVTDTVNIATGNTVGTGSKVVHIADGTPAGTNLVTIGSNANTANVTTIRGGNGTGAIALTPQTTGTIVIGAAAGTGVIGIGTSSATQVVNVGNGAGVSTVNLAVTSVVGSNVNMATAVTGAGITDTVAISTGNAAATGVKVVNIATGTPGTSGNNKVTIGGGTASAVTLNAVVRSYQAPNYIGTESGANNALVAALLDAGGNAVTVAAGLIIWLKLGHTLQAGANTLNLNSHGTDSIKKASNPATDLSVTAASGSILMMIFDGTVFQVQGF